MTFQIMEIVETTLLGLNWTEPKLVNQNQCQYREVNPCQSSWVGSKLLAVILSNM